MKATRLHAFAWCFFFLLVGCQAPEQAGISNDDTKLTVLSKVSDGSSSESLSGPIEQELDTQSGEADSVESEPTTTTSESTPEDPEPTAKVEPEAVPEPTVEPVPIEPVEIACTTDTFQQRAEDELLNKTDILFVMDNSGSMLDDWQRVANNIRNLVNEIPEGVDVRFGVLLGHVAEFEGQLFSADDVPKVLDGTKLTAEEVGEALFLSFSAGMEKQDPGTGEAAFRSLQRSVTEHLKENRKLGFFRKDAALSIVFMSDENEIGFAFPEDKEIQRPDRCDGFWEDRIKKIFYDDCGITLATVVSALKIAKEEYPVTAHAFVNITPEDLFTNNSPEESCLYDSLGYGYFEIVEELGGVLYSLQADRSTGMGQVGEAVRRSLKQIHDFKLTKFYWNVDPKTIVAKVNGETQPHKFNRRNNVVHMDNAGAPLSTITISYCEEPPKPPAPPKPKPVPKPAPKPAPAPAPNSDPVPTSDPLPESPPEPKVEDCMKDYSDPCDYADKSSWQVSGLDASTTVDSAYVIWQTDGVLTIGVLQIGLTEAELQRAEKQPYREFVLGANQHVQALSIKNLTPGTRYYFRVMAMDMSGRTVLSNIISKTTKEN